jgi:hypothetical protein
MSTAFSPAQLRASLWAKQGARVYAVIDGLIVPDIAAKLKAADVAGWDCLQRGALSADAERKASYLVELKDVSAFTDWLLEEATPVFPGWGVLMVSDRTLLPMREHCRSIGEVATPDGERRAWRWFDPDVLRAVLPSFLGGQLDEFFAAGQVVVLPEPSGWTWLAMERGVLTTDTRALMAATR